MKIAVVGATGMVGEVVLQVLKEREFPISELIPVASERSIGKKILFDNAEHNVISVEEALKKKPDIAIFSAGGTMSLQWAPEFANNNTVVIDNSSAWRMHPDIKLIVPEVNIDVLTKNDKIIANPNCSTIQLVMILNPLNKKFNLKRVVVSTYQSTTGTGKPAVDQMFNERIGIQGNMAYPYKIDLNCIPHCDDFIENDYTKEEMKLINEPRKIMDLPELKLTATAVRIPVIGGHSESVNIEFHNDFSIETVRNTLSSCAGVILKDDPENNLYPMPLSGEGKDEVFVGRIRRDESQSNTLNLWIVADNLRKGAATNAVQIAEFIVRKEWV